MAEREQRVTPLELFFDLVLVFAITQVTRLMSDDPTWPGLGRGLLILAALWWAWTGYAWLTNTLEPEEGLVRAGMFAAMAAMLVVALAVPEAFDADAVLFGVAFLIVRVLHVGLYAIAGKRDPDLLGAVLRLVPPAISAPVLIVIAGFVDGGAQAALWVVALAVDYLGVLRGRMEGWRVSPAHFAERHGLIVIIALGESVVAIGIGAADVSLTPGIVAAAVLGIVIIAALWWAYFDVYAVDAQRRLSETKGVARALTGTRLLQLPAHADDRGHRPLRTRPEEDGRACRRPAGHRSRRRALRRAVALLPHPRRAPHSLGPDHPPLDDGEAGMDRPRQTRHRAGDARSPAGRSRATGARRTCAGRRDLLCPDRLGRHPLPRGPLPRASRAPIVQACSR